MRLAGRTHVSAVGAMCTMGRGLVRSLGVGAHPTRLRVDVPGAFGDPIRAGQARRALAEIDGIREVTVSTHTGRALVVALEIDAAMLSQIERAVATLPGPRAPAPPTLGRLKEATRRALATMAPPPTRDEVGAGQDAPRPAFHAMSVDELLAEVGATRSGLSESAASKRLREVGPNVLGGVPRRTAWQILAGQIFTVPTALLGGAIALSLALGDALEAGTIALVIGSNIVVGYYTEARAEELLDAWRELRAPHARVLRPGREVTIDPRAIVPGDVLVLRPGQPIAADARVVVSGALEVDESTLTGESEPVEKSPDAVPEGTVLADRANMVYAGTQVAAGSGRAVVVATGARTEVGRVEHALARAETRAAPLERQLDVLGRRLAELSLASAVGIVALGLLRGRPLATLVRSAVALGVAAVPEGVPTVGTTALSLASHRLKKSGIVIRRLAAAETLGAVGVVCADKTGTLTENRMRVTEVCTPTFGWARVAWTGSRAAALIDDRGRELPTNAARELARIAALNADVDVTDAGEITKGSGTEQALVQFAMGTGYPVPDRRRHARRLREQRRSAEVPIMITVHEHPELGEIELAKGAPEAILVRCDLPADGRREALAQNDAMASRGLRVLAFAWRADGRAGHERPLTFAGLVGLRDPPRPGARHALATFAAAGIETYMLTGDQEKTAIAIGRELGIPEARIFSRITSEDKLAIVEKLQAEGHIVAMTGDGVNDAPALRAADVGVAMGGRGTTIARAVADVVLANDDLPSLALAVREGRTLHDNVRRAIDYLVATNTSEVEVMLAGSLFGLSPLAPLQLLWLNILTDVAPALVLAIEPSERDVMLRPPRDPRRPLLARRDLERLGRQSVGMAAAGLAGYALGAARGRGARYASTTSFASLVTAQLLHVRRERAHGARERDWLDLVLAASFAVQAAALATPALRRALGNARLEAADLALAFAVGLAPSLAGARSRLGAPAAGEIVVVRSADIPRGGERARVST